ncbi:hypothetical protein F8388_020349 [Cannabis sativa]|uniref:Uncharacterized protein n=1 Tax=Cannabis sativa TaxID=3483 RepID=A0A7J6HGW1_CANSA|nr:hypothetical protein G4B88_015319 [Cannabis sativa]KAF4394524.1 hypothetical protein F8388_020349 [Cannabis sativa]
MLVEFVKATIKNVAQLMEKINDNIDIAKMMRIEDYLTPQNLRCIKKLYSELGVDDIVDAMRKNPLGMSPFILRELEQEYEKLARRRCDKNKDWADVYKKNYRKSLGRPLNRNYKMFEFDMLVESVKVTIKNVAQLMEKINDNIGIAEMIRIEDYLTLQNLRCIEKLYSKLGVDDIVDAMRKNPLGTSPFILRELEQEYKKLTRYRCDKNKNWVDVYKKNYRKSLGWPPNRNCQDIKNSS